MDGRCHNNYKYLHIILGIFYFTLGNLRPSLRSTQRSIQLIACVTSRMLVKYGFESVLKPFIDDVNVLETVSMWFSQTIYIIFAFLCRQELILSLMDIVKM